MCLRCVRRPEWSCQRVCVAVPPPPPPPIFPFFHHENNLQREKKMQYSTLVVLLYSWLRWKKMEIERDGGWGGWGRCKVINNLWVKSNKRRGGGWGLGIALADRPCLLRRHIIIMPQSWKVEMGRPSSPLVFKYVFSSCIQERPVISSSSQLDFFS